jgi:hypothetical protein
MDGLAATAVLALEIVVLAETLSSCVANVSATAGAVSTGLEIPSPLTDDVFSAAWTIPIALLLAGDVTTLDSCWPAKAAAFRPLPDLPLFSTPATASSSVFTLP